MSGKTMVPVTVSMPSELAQASRVAAALEQKSRSQLVREVLQEGLRDRGYAGDSTREGDREGLRDD